ncbi:hypothetical protein ACFVTY_35870 [Streptomyces sp. NPDC058067]|uniref:hypothetical protein n=1 Tax=Streptomyces sp. NPDC058067 TaxID=3346324 RepID=UPI0036E2E75E
MILAELLHTAARHLDHVHEQFTVAAQNAAPTLTRAASGKSSINALDVLQNSAAQIDILAARRADAVERLKEVFARANDAPLTAHRKGSPLSDHFRFGVHPDHGFVAAATANVPSHLANWFLVREQFEPVPGTRGLYRLTNPEQDGIRRTRQAVHDLRRHGYEVQADYSLDPGRSASPPRPAVRNGLLERRNRIAQAAATRSSQQRGAPAASLPEFLPRPGAVPLGGLTQAAGQWRSR